MSAEFDTSHFPVPKEFEEKLKEFEQRLTILEKGKVKTHTIGIVSPLSTRFPGAICTE